MKFSIKLLYLLLTFFAINAYEYQLSVCALFQDEAPYLQEWLEFHCLVGVEHFYLYNNLSTDNFQQILKPYEEQGIVTLIDWPIKAEGNWSHVQIGAYKNAIERARKHSKWLAFLDIDEFLFAMHEDNLANFLKNYENFGGIGVNWQMFGTSFINKIPDNQLLIDALRLKAVDNEDVNKHIKSIVQPEFVINCHHIHYMQYKPGYFQVTPSKVKFDGARSPEVDASLIRINHYWARDEYYFEQIKLPRRARWGDANIDGWRHVNKNLLNKIADDAILRFVPALKKALKK